MLQQKAIKEDGTRIIEFPGLGRSELGFISVAQSDNVPFAIKRVYWTYFTPHDIIRGGHAHRYLEQLVIAVSGTIIFDLLWPNGETARVELTAPNMGLYMPPMVWADIKFSHSAVLLCLASGEYDEEDYIRNIEEFKSLK